MNSNSHGIGAAAAAAGQTVLIPKLRPNSISTYAKLLETIRILIILATL